MPIHQSSYRPHDKGHDYYRPGIYLITLVTRGRQPLLARLNDDERQPAVTLTSLGQAVWDEWQKTPGMQALKGNDMTLVTQVVMPDHWHGVIRVNAQMQKSLGAIIQMVKSACTAQWRRMTSGAMGAAGGISEPSSAQMIRHMSHQQRAAYYATCPRSKQPLWDDDYDDTICLTDARTGACDQRHYQAMVRYVNDNPRRAIIRRLRPDFMRRVLHVRIAGREYAAFGNLFLLRWPRRIQVFCHRRARLAQLTEVERVQYGYAHSHDPETVTRVAYEKTDDYSRLCSTLKRMVMEGATAVVTPGISAGERIVKNRCLEAGYPLIHLQKEPIGQYWKPEVARFDACAHGALLILAPWRPEMLGVVNNVPANTDYSIFHNLNTLAEEICAFDGEAQIVR